MELSKTDRGIIEKLREDARQSNRAIGKALGISEETVRRRTHAMVEAGVIHFGIRVSAEHLGYGVSAMLVVQLWRGTTATEIAAKLLDPLSSSVHIDHMSATIDEGLAVTISAEGSKAVHDQIYYIRSLDGVENVSVLLLHNETDWYI